MSSNPWRAPARNGQHSAVAGLGTGQGRAGAGHRRAGVCGLHGRLVRDLPVQQENHAGQCRRAGRLCGAKKVTLLRADWTRRDPAITAALAQLGRNGVPVYVLYQAGRAPVVLSEILSVNEVRSALATL